MRKRLLIIHLTGQSRSSEQMRRYAVSTLLPWVFLLTGRLTKDFRRCESLAVLMRSQQAENG